MQDSALILVVILILVIVWRGPTTLPQLGAMLGRTVKQARRQVESARAGQDNGDKPA